MKRFSVFVAAVAFVLVFFCACGEKRKLYDTWVSTSEIGTQLVLTEDGKASLEIDRLKLEGTYVVEGDVITMFLLDSQGVQHTIAAVFELTDTELILTNSQGQSEVFR